MNKIDLATKPDGRLRQFLTRQQVAKALQLHIHTVSALVTRKELTAVKVACKTRIPTEELERYLQRSRTGRPFWPDTHPRKDEPEAHESAASDATNIVHRNRKAPGMAARFSIETMAEPEHDDPRALEVLMNKARMLRLSVVTRIATTAAKWERAIREAFDMSIKSDKPAGVSA